jgi:hypothetical protein
MMLPAYLDKSRPYLLYQHNVEQSASCMHSSRARLSCKRPHAQLASAAQQLHQARDATCPVDGTLQWGIMAKAAVM